LSGWLGHQAPFAFDLDYRPGEGISRMRVGTPPVIQMAVLDAALDAFDGIEMADIRSALHRALRTVHLGSRGRLQGCGTRQSA
jgi:kynureninase